MRPFCFLSTLLICTLASLSGCDPGLDATCRSVTERIYVNDRFPSGNEKFNPDSMRVLTFEYDFNDSVAVFSGNNRLAGGFMATGSNGYAGRLRISAQPNEELTLVTTHGCAHFRLKDGYRYLYITRQDNTRWEVAYANIGKGYF